MGPLMVFLFVSISVYDMWKRQLMSEEINFVFFLENEDKRMDNGQLRHAD